MRGQPTTQHAARKRGRGHQPQRPEHPGVNPLGGHQEHHPPYHAVAHYNPGWSLGRSVFLRRNRTRRLPSVYNRTRVNSQPRYSASMDNRVDADSRVTSGGSRSGTHS